VACRKARWPKGRTSGGVFSTEEIALYLRDKDFRRNEAIFILNHVDLMPVEDLAEAWNLSVDEVKKIIALHTEYWEATETTV
jgi:hypothetical protein